MPRYWLPPAWCVSVCVLSFLANVSDQLSRAELMHSTINTWPPIPSFIYSAMSQAWPSLSLCTSPFILQPVIQLGFIKGTEHHNKLYYLAARREFIENLHFFYFPHSSVFLHIILPLSLTAPILPRSFSVPTYYWWVDFTSQWCREGTVEYAVCECE